MSSSSSDDDDDDEEEVGEEAQEEEEVSSSNGDSDEKESERADHGAGETAADDSEKSGKKDHEDSWDDEEDNEGTRSRDNPRLNRFTNEEYELIYGKSRAPKPSEQPQLLRATINQKTFGKAETLASRDARSLLPRLRSIYLDATSFVSRIRAEFDRFPCVANLRNGLWYFERPPDAECRFRSSDGHSRSWQFHLSRANLACAQLAFEKGGICLVDSTRSGKSFPDSFNRTVPLWCAVVNRTMGHAKAELHLPSWIPATEKRHITERQLDAWAAELKEFLEKTKTVVKSTMPLCPFWIANDMQAWGLSSHRLDELALEVMARDGAVIPVICISASAVIDPETHRERFSWAYVPGAADDEENWSRGLTPQLFWQNCVQLVNMCTTSKECEDVVADLVAANQQQHGNKTAEIGNDGQLKVTNRFIITDTMQIEWGSTFSPVLNGNVLDLTWLCGHDKAWCRKNSLAWSNKALPAGFAQFRRFFRLVDKQEPSCHFVIRAQDGETALTMALALTCVFYDDQLHLRVDELSDAVDKQLIKRREASIIAKAQSAAGMCPAISRRLVKEVSEFLCTKKHLDSLAHSACVTSECPKSPLPKQ